jgi:hypothetical protein
MSERILVTGAGVAGSKLSFALLCGLSQCQHFGLRRTAAFGKGGVAGLDGLRPAAGADQVGSRAPVGNT